MKKFVSTLFVGMFAISSFTFASDLENLLNEISNLDNTGTTNTATHWAGEVSIENISYTTDGKDLYTVSRTPLVGNTNVKVEIKESKEADYFTLNTVKGSDGKIDIKLPTAGQYQVRLTALDSTSNTAVSKEYIQTIKVDWAPAPTPTVTSPKTDPVTTTTNTPQVMDSKTGPKESAMVFSVLMGLIFYGIYKFRKTN